MSHLVNEGPRTYECSCDNVNAHYSGRTKADAEHEAAQAALRQEMGRLRDCIRDRERAELSAIGEADELSAENKQLRAQLDRTKAELEEERRTNMWRARLDAATKKPRRRG